MKAVFLILITLVLISSSLAQEDQIYVYGQGSVLSGFNIYNKATGELICYAAATTNGKFDCKGDSWAVIGGEEFTKIINDAIAAALSNIELEAIPVYYDPDNPDPDTPDWEATKENAFTESCTACHATETDEKYLFTKFNKEPTDWTTTLEVPKDKGHKKHVNSTEEVIACTACHRKI
jgi:hypothetical protein